jgi:hypothetical protein
MRYLKFGVLLVLACVVLVGVRLALAQAPTVYVNEPFSVAAYHNGENTTSYHLTITGPGSGYQADLPVSALSAGSIIFPLTTGLSGQGNYTAVVTATGEGGSSPSAPFAFAAVARPSAPPIPTGLRLIK